MAYNIKYDNEEKAYETHQRGFSQIDSGVDAGKEENSV